MCQRAHRLLVAFLLVSLPASVSARADPITVTFTAFPALGDPLNTGPSTGTFTFASSLLGCGPNPRAEAVFCGAPNTLPGQGQILNTSVGLGATTISFAWSGTQWTTANADIAVLNFDLSSGALLGWRLAGRPPGGTFLDPMVLSPAAAVVTDFDAVSSRFGSFVDYTISGHEGPFRGLIATESAAPVPEPSSVLLLGTGIALFWARQRPRQVNRRRGIVSSLNGVVLTTTILLRAPGPVVAEPIRLLETAEFFPGQGGGGYALSDDQYVGVRFYLPSPVVTSTIGGQLGTEFPNGVDVFAALVRLSGATDLPNSTALDSTDVLGTTLLRVAPGPGMSGDFAAAINLELPAGWYAAVYGAGGAFGSSPPPLYAAASNGVTQRFSTWPFFLVRPIHNIFQEIPNRQLRFFLDGTGEPASAPAAPVPEPASVFLLALGLVGMGVRRWRQRKV